MCLRFEDGNSPAWRRRVGGEESQSDPQVSTEHVLLHRCATLWHAGESEGERRSSSSWFFSSSVLTVSSLSPPQVYQSDSGQLMFMNKYHGRKLNLTGFKEALCQFFHNGRHLRQELLSPVLRRLREMQAALEACESYRFYSSSLLVIYDGDPPRTSTRPRHRGGEEGEEDEPSDEEEEEEEGGAYGHSSHSTTEATSPMVDVRMIDFAHTTCRHYGEDSVVHEGQDSGFIFGLQNLISIISQLEDHSSD